MFKFRKLLPAYPPAEPHLQPKDFRPLYLDARVAWRYVVAWRHFRKTSRFEACCLRCWTGDDCSLRGARRAVGERKAHPSVVARCWLFAGVR